MANINSVLTVLTCRDEENRAVKTFMNQEGEIRPVPYNAGTFFYHEEMPVNNLKTLGEALYILEDEPKKFVIRGQIKPNMPKKVRRKTHDPHAAFDDVARPYVMLDIDKFNCPEFMDPANKPEEAIAFVLAGLPKPFSEASCYYQFSSSQNVLLDNDSRANKLSVHLWFWCDREVSNLEWKTFFKASIVDLQLFNPVQAHYTARPIFKNMEDVLPNRSGFHEGEYDTVPVPEINIKERPKASSNRQEVEPVVNEGSRTTALELLKPYYKEGKRDRMSGALAATLYRGGWHVENAAEFVHDLALLCSDEEADSRYKGAFRICDAVDNGKPAQGIPTLKNEIGIDNLSNILFLLGISQSNTLQVIDQLTSKSSYEDIKKAVIALLDLPESQQNMALKKIKDTVKTDMASLRSLMKEVKLEFRNMPSRDWADHISQAFLNNYFHGCQHFLRSADKRYWQYNGLYWEVAPDDLVKQDMIDCARGIKNENDLEHGLDGLVRAALSLLEGESFERSNPFGLGNQDMPLVINCLNAELWFEGDGQVTPKPHRAENYLRYCLDVNYAPQAKAPKFKQALLEIFANSSNPEHMYEHFMEVAGYICQPWRKRAMITVLHGSGGNGKSSLMSIIIRILGLDMVISGRISEIGKDKFKIGDLDGKLMVYEDDVSSNTRLDDGFLKTISEARPLTGEQKYKDSFQFICRAVPVMLTNDFPKCFDNTDGFWRRVLVIPFNRQFKRGEQNFELFDEIWESEASGILNEIIAGFVRFKQRGEFLEPKDCVAAKNEWITNSNVLPRFINEECVIDSKHTQKLRDFYAYFKSYCEDLGVHTPRPDWVTKSLEKMGYEIVPSSGGYPLVRGIHCRGI